MKAYRIYNEAGVNKFFTNLDKAYGFFIHLSESNNIEGHIYSDCMLMQNLYNLTEVTGSFYLNAGTHIEQWFVESILIY